MDHLDDMLSRLREAPLDPRLAGLDSRVMAEIARLIQIGRQRQCQRAVIDIDRRMRRKNLRILR